MTKRAASGTPAAIERLWDHCVPSDDVGFRLLRVCESFDGCYVCEYYVEMDGVRRLLKDVLRENVEQKRHIRQLMIQNTLLRDRLGFIETQVIHMGDDDE